MNRELIAKRLADLRGSRTQREVARNVGISPSAYAMYESARRVPTDEIKIRLAEYYQRTVQDIFF